MAEFIEVVMQARRMCKTIRDCTQCPAHIAGDCRVANVIDRCVPDAEVYAIERMVGKWAEEHPEPRYPSWNEAWKQLFPDAIKGSCPCKQHFIGREYVGKACYGEGCRECLEQPMTADIAEKLGIKPIGGDDE